MGGKLVFSGKGVSGLSEVVGTSAILLNFNFVRGEESEYMSNISETISNIYFLLKLTPSAKYIFIPGVSSSVTLFSHTKWASFLLPFQ